MIQEKIYYFIELTTKAPLSIGNGDNELTDHDLIRNAEGRPFIPATSIAGVCLHSLSTEEQKIINPEMGNEKMQSALFISDALLLGRESTSVRDGIEVNENKITKTGAKYDMEIIETGSKFCFRMEVTVRDNQNAKEMETIVNKILAGIDEGNILLGLKSNRGFGKLKIEEVRRKSFRPENREELLKFQKYNRESYEPFEREAVSSQVDTIAVELKQLGGISIRRYSAQKDDIDFEHIKSNGTPVIPGTSWAGLIRKQMEYYHQKMEEQGKRYELRNYLGFVEKEEAQASKMIIEESIIDGGKEITLTRNKIDRFSGGAANSALFSEKAWFNGRTKLTIKLKETDNYIKTLILLTIKDIENGLIALGGQTAIGRGIFAVEKVWINGELVNVEEELAKNKDIGGAN